MATDYVQDAYTISVEEWAVFDPLTGAPSNIDTVIATSGTTGLTYVGGQLAIKGVAVQNGFLAGLDSNGQPITVTPDELEANFDPEI